MPSSIGDPVRRTTSKKLSVGASAACAMAGMTHIGVAWYYGVTLPTEADAAKGRMAPMDFHGMVVYLLEGEVAVLDGLLALFVAGLAVFLFTELLFDPHGWRRRSRSGEA